MKKSARESEVHLTVGTRKGGFLFRSDQRRWRWRITGPFFPGWEVNHLIRDQSAFLTTAAVDAAKDPATKARANSLCTSLSVEHVVKRRDESRPYIP